MPRARSVAELPNEEVKGHQGFTARPLMDLTDKGVTIRMLGISPAGIGPVRARESCLTILGTMYRERAGFAYVNVGQTITQVVLPSALSCVYV